ncbi:transporter substrate-binding domain-containing protein [Pelagicoccus sp. SDUM812002]|uniref:response regulator n=1 Tax=Pelagicoccus sp. SDUM812002 TaxID=3041266 RepID=UPI00280DC8DD|nr:transporter substrate-binding domain-containing protein [Pelagicoccus sp. SDUM812002]MDQ8187305.1 transporter substrate-binding domain-containing protein [Pelagicoccus sp. SDUM812002]
MAKLSPMSLLPRNSIGTLFALCLLLCVATSSNRETQAADAGNDDGIIRIGLADDYAPLSRLSGNEVEGYLVDLARRIEGPLDQKVTIGASSWTELENQLENGDIDAIFGLYYSESRNQKYAFGPSIFRNKVLLYLDAKAEEATSLHQLEAGRFAVVGPDSVITKMVTAQFPQIEWVVLENLSELESALSEDFELDGFVEEAQIASYLIPKIVGRNFTASDDVITEQDLRPVTLRSRATLARRISHAINSLPESEVAAMQIRWTLPASGIRPLNKPENQKLYLNSAEQRFLASHPTIRVASDPAWPPLSFRGQDGSLRGIQHDILRIVEERLDIRFEFPSFQDWPEIRQSFEDGSAEIRSGSSEELNATIPYLTLPIVLATRLDQPLGVRLSDLNGKKVSIEAGNPYAYMISALYPEISVVESRTDQEGLELLLQGQVDGHVGNYAVVAYLVRASYAGSFRISNKIGVSTSLSFVIRKDLEWQPLLGLMNKAIASISESEREAILEDWIKVEVSRTLDQEVWVKLAAIVLTIFALALAWRLSTLRIRRELVRARERNLLADKVGAGGRFEWFPGKGKVRFSPEFFRILGYSERDLEHSEKTLQDLTHPDDFRTGARQTKLCVMRGTPYNFKLRMQRCDGSWAWISTQGVPTHFYPKGSVKRYIGVFLDITELQDTINKLHEQQEVAKKASRAKSEFLANMSHEIRTPMNAVLGFSRLLLRDPQLTQQQREYSRMINTNSEHLLSLLDGILDMAKIEARKTSLTEQNLDLTLLLDETASLFRARCDEKGLRFEYVIEAGVPKRIGTDGTKLRQIIYNLLTNSLKFTDRGAISLHVCVNNEELQITVADTGAGISAEEQAKLFRPFNQGAAGTAKSGTGLGLAICKEFSRLMGGDIILQSTQGEGSNFIVRLPFVELEIHPQEEEPLVRIPYKEAASQTLLIVDDKLPNLQYMERFLCESGFAIYLAENGIEAIRKWKEQSPDLILLDLRMPEMDGYEVIRRIRGQDELPQPKILALTASAFNEQRERVLRDGADGFMTKPFDENVLLKRIAALLNLPTVSKDTPLSITTPHPIPKLDAQIELDPHLQRVIVDACRGGYLEKLERAIATLSLSQPAVAAHLKELAHNFDYERILSLISPTLEKQEQP